ncbi:tRNA (N(6)-L-threonylcarbamoyladenosine(37)-C(2))-methylthiotransferase MtaB, partial [Candidatus Acetothermia bacterium]
MNRPSVSFVTFGCRVNQYDEWAMRRILAEGYRLTEGIGDVVLLNACTVTALADR